MMRSLRTARSRAIFGSTVLVVFFAGVAAAALWRVQDDHTEIARWLVVGLSGLAFLIAAGLVALVVSVLRPLAALRASAGAIASGDLGARASVSGPEEVASLARDFSEMTDALAATTKEYIDTTNLTGVILLRTDKDNRVTFLNDAMCEFLGRPREEVLGTEVVSYLHPDDATSTAKAVQRMVKSKGLVTGVVTRYVTPMGIRVTEWSGYPIFDEEGRYVGLHGAGRDISERVRTEETLREGEMRLRTLFEEAVNPVLVVDESGLYIDANTAALQFLECGRQELLGKEVWDFVPPDLLEQQRQEHSPFFSRRTVETDYFVHGKVKTLLLNVVPLSVNGKKILYGIGQDISERKRVEQALRESEERYRLVAENATDVIWTMDMNLRQTYVSPSVTALRGYSVEEVMAQTLEDIFTPASFAVVMKTLREELAIEKRGQQDLCRSRTLELEQVCKDGSTVWTEIRVALLRDADGQAVGIVGVTRDVSKRKRTEQALRESEECYRQLADSITDVFFAMDRDLKYTYWNKASEELTGISAADAIGQSLYDIFSEVKGTMADELYQEVLRTQQPRSFVNEYRLGGKDFAFEISAYPSGTGLSVFVKDVTARKRAEEALRESEEKYRAVFEQAPDSVLLIDAETGGFVEFNDRAHQALGYTREEFEKLRIPDFEAIEFPEEVAKHIKKIVEEGTAIFETKHRTKGGEIRDVEVRTRAISIRGRDFIETIFHDISERNRAEEALRESEERFRGLAEATFEGIVIHDRGRILDANQVFANMFGYGLSEIIGVHVLDLAAPESRDLASQRIVSKSQEPFEVIGLRKDGSTFPCEVWGRALRYRGCKVTVVAVRDISGRKQAEEALQRAREEIESRVERRMQQVNGYRLTFRELTVLHLVAAGESDKEIAAVLGISPLTAHKHIANILEKMGASCRTEAGVRALREGLLD